MVVIVDPFVPNPVLYILVRTDMESMNPGKMGAQTAHAASAFAFNQELSPQVEGMYDQWRDQTRQGFGTTITLRVWRGADLGHFVEEAHKIGCLGSVIHDPTYPVRDGPITHLIPVDTCAYIFGDKGELQHIISRQERYP